MRRFVLPVLALGDLALAALLAWLWIGPDGRPRPLAWQPPAPVKPAVAEPLPMPPFEVDTQSYVATLERPLFIAGRRPPRPPEPPPPAPPPPVPPPAPEPLPDIRLVGLYSSGDAGGVVATVDGRVRRLRLGEAVGSWSLKAIQGQEIVLARGDEVRTIEIKRRTGAEPGAAAAAPSAGAASGAAPAPAEGGNASSRYFSAEKERVRDQVRRMNVLRARSGLPPLPEP